MTAHQGADSSKPISPPRPRHQISRSITELSSPIRLHRHHPLRHRHHQHDRDDRAPQSAAPSLHLGVAHRGSLDIPRPAFGTPSMTSPEQSRRTSMVPSGAEDESSSGVAAAARQQKIWEDGERAMARTTDLRRSLVDLHVFSNEATRRLDDTYYAVLEKLSTLQGTLLAMKEIAGMSRDINTAFVSDSRGLVTEIETQLDAFGQFDEQQGRINTLQKRITAGREKVQRLSGRVDAVRERIGAWEKADMEWQERTRKRLKVIWTVMLVVITGVAVLFAIAQYAPMVDVSIVSSPPKQGQEAIDEALARNGSVADDLGADVRAALDRKRQDAQMRDERVLRALDEL